MFAWPARMARLYMARVDCLSESCSLDLKPNLKPNLESESCTGTTKIHGIHIQPQRIIPVLPSCNCRPYFNCGRAYSRQRTCAGKPWVITPLKPHFPCDRGGKFAMNPTLCHHFLILHPWPHTMSLQLPFFWPWDSNITMMMGRA